MTRHNMLNISLALLLLAAAGCGSSAPTPGKLAALYQYANEDRWDEVMPGIKAFLLRAPKDASAHWLLGRAHMHLDGEKGLGLAEGELQFARRLAKTDGPGMLPDAPAPPQFEARICADLAQVQVLRAQFALSREMPKPFIRSLAQHAQEYIAQGLSADPNDPELNETDKTLKDFLTSMDTPES